MLSTPRTRDQGSWFYISMPILHNNLKILSGKCTCFTTTCFILLLLIVLLQASLINAHTSIEVNYDILNYTIMKRNEPLTIICKNKINSAFIEWAYPPIPSQERVNIRHGVISVLTIDNATDSDTGVYKCTIPYTFADGRTRDVEERVIVAVEPIVTMEEYVSVSAGDKLELNCNASRAYPTSTIDFWKIEHDDKTHIQNKIEKEECNDDYCEEINTEYYKITESKYRWKLETFLGIPKSRLVIENVAIHDSGKYTCQFKNIAGSAHIFATVIVKEKDSSLSSVLFLLKTGALAILLITVAIYLGYKIIIHILYVYLRSQKEIQLRETSNKRRNEGLQKRSNEEEVM